MNPVTRRNALTLTALGSVAAAPGAYTATSGNPDEPLQGAVNAKPGSLADPGPKNPALASHFPSFNNPSPTDIGEMPLFRGSLRNAPKRFQGGWTRQAEFAISDAVSGVNMPLSAVGTRELRWHRAAEWADMAGGQCRIAILDADGRTCAQDVKTGTLWHSPPGLPRSLPGLGPEGCEFMQEVEGRWRADPKQADGATP